MYRELLLRYITNHRWAKLQKPCHENDISEAEKYIGCKFPTELKNLLIETDGDNWFLLSLKEIVENVRINREIYAQYLDGNEFNEKIDRFIYFATNGCGDYYGYKILENNKTDLSAIYFWEHELFETKKVAENIYDLITKYYNDEI